MDVFENERGTFIFNSKDLCTIRHIPELVQSGIASLKIEGRVKTSYYVATVVGAYRREIDRLSLIHIWNRLCLFRFFCANKSKSTPVSDVLFVFKDFL